MVRPGITCVVLASAAACAPLYSSGTVEALDPRAVQPERPSVATHAGTVAPGYLEVETGIEHDRNPDATHSFLIPTVLKIGVTPVAQLSLFTPAESATGVPLGMGDLAAGIKWRIVDGDGPLGRVAILPIVKWNTGGDRGSQTTDASVVFIDSRSIGPVSLDLNVGVTRHSGDASITPRSSSFWTASSGIPVAGPIGWQLECFGFPGTHGPSGQAPTVAILTGPTLGAWRSLAIDAGIIVPVTGPQAHAWYAGLVANVGRILPAR